MPKKSVLEFVHTLDTLELWWSNNRNRKTIYTPSEIQHETGLYSQALPDALAVLGWTRAKHWFRENNRRVLRTHYAPPGHSIPAPPRGRPSTDSVVASILDNPH